jgi:hypothetical protein
MNRKRANVGALLRHVNAGHHVEDFPGTKYEQLALIQAASKLRLITRHTVSGRYEVTPIGRLHMTPRPFGLTSLIGGTAVGAAIGVLALTVLWSPSDAARWPTDGQFAAVSVSVSPVANVGVRGPIIRQTASPTLDAAPMHVDGSISTPAVGNPEQPPFVSDQPVSEQPNAPVPPTVVKQRAKPPQTGRASVSPRQGFAKSYRDERYESSGPIVR